MMALSEATDRTDLTRPCREGTGTERHKRAQCAVPSRDWVGDGGHHGKEWSGGQESPEVYSKAFTILKQKHAARLPVLSQFRSYF